MTNSTEEKYLVYPAQYSYYTMYVCSPIDGSKFPLTMPARITSDELAIKYAQEYEAAHKHQGRALKVAKIQYNTVTNRDVEFKI